MKVRVISTFNLSKRARHCVAFDIILLERIEIIEVSGEQFWNESCLYFGLDHFLSLPNRIKKIFQNSGL